MNSFELRMYDPAIERWLSVDPKREFASGYVGMGNNPTSIVDPDGGKIKIKYKEDGVRQKGTYDSEKNAFFDKKGNQLSGVYVDGVIASFDYVRPTDVKGVIDFVASIEKSFAIKQSKSIGMEELVNGKWTYYNLNSGLELMNSNGGLTGQTQSPAMGLYHEIVHFYNREMDPVGFLIRLSFKMLHYKNLEEYNVISIYEKNAATILGEGIRNNHYGQPFKTSVPTQTK